MRVVAQSDRTIATYTRWYRMQTNLRVDGANCPFCLNDVVDRLRMIDGITASTARSVKAASPSNMMILM